MAVKTESLENGERDMALQDREGKGNRGVQTTMDAAAQLVALRQRMRRAANEVGEDPRPKDAPPCRECFQRGWLAAIAALSKD
jgi:hypothetical protein